MINLLIIDDNLSFFRDMEIQFGKNYKILKAETGKKGLSILKEENVAAVLLNLQLPDVSGIELLKQIHSEIDPYKPVIIITDYGNIENAVTAMKSGAYDFIQKSFSRDLLIEKINKALEKRELDIGIKVLKDSVDQQHDYFVCTSRAMKNLDNEITKVARQDVDILISGETGTGKDVVAYEIHKRSRRKDKLFVHVPLNSLSDTLIESELFGYEKGAFSGAYSAKIGKFEAANGGTIYLPEISEISERVQLKLLSFMQYKEIIKVGQGSAKKINLDVRIIMATNADLKKLLAQGKIREDFYYRINVINIAIPPLRERKDGIKAFANYFLNFYLYKHNKKGISFDNELLDQIERFRWNGNIRELKNAVERAVVLSEDDNILTIDNFPVLMDFACSDNQNDGTLKFYLDNCKREYFLSLLAETNGNRSKAAEKAGLSRQGLLKMLNELDIK